ncbi:hypothetical protein [Zhongshania aliphaticivorans]|uniref:hypothetical protein n=1 Tax=Zhongshania aliphaticivorans TaxID=1470434 RepID=UPI0039C90F79
MDDRDQMFKWMMETNLSLVAQFHNHVNVILAEKSSEIESVEELKKADKAYWKQNYENHFPKKLRETAFLLMFGHLEEMLFLLSQSFNPHKTELGKGMGIVKFKPYIKSLLNEELASSTDYQTIRGAQFVRNSLMHIAGRVSLSKNRSDLERLVREFPDSYKVKNDRIIVTVEGLKVFQTSVRGLTNTLLNKSSQQGASKAGASA